MSEENARNDNARLARLEGRMDTVVESVEKIGRQVDSIATSRLWNPGLVVSICALVLTLVTSCVVAFSVLAQQSSANEIGRLENERELEIFWDLRFKQFDEAKDSAYEVGKRDQRIQALEEKVERIDKAGSIRWQSDDHKQP